MYVATSDLRTYLGIASTTADTLLGNAVSEATAYIEQRTGCVFEGSTGTRYYRADDLLYLPGPEGAPGYGLNRLYPGIGPIGLGLDSGRSYISNVYSRRLLDLRTDLCALGGITNGDGTTLASTDLWLEPRNDPPYRVIRLKSAASWIFGTDGEITISGTWGYSTAPPNDIVAATKQLASYYYKQRETQVFDVTANAESGSLTIPKGVPASVDRILKDGAWVRNWRIV